MTRQSILSLAIALLLCAPLVLAATSDPIGASSDVTTPAAQTQEEIVRAAILAYASGELPLDLPVDEPEPVRQLRENLTPLKGGEGVDPWVDVLGDTMWGPLDMGLMPIVFNEHPLYSPRPGVLEFAGARVCLYDVDLSPCAELYGSVKAIEAADGLIGGNITKAGRIGIAPEGVDTTKLANESVVTGKLAPGAVTTPKIADLAITTDKLADDAVRGDKIADGAIRAPHLGEGVVTTGKLADLAVTPEKIVADAVRGNHILDGTVQDVDLSDNAITSRKLANLSVTGDKIAEGAIRTNHIVDGSVGVADLADGAVTSAKLASGVLTSAHITDGAITTAKLGAGAVTEPTIAPGAVTNAKLADAVITAAKLADGAVTFAKLALGSVTSSALATDSVTTPKILDGAVTTPKLADASVTAAKLAEDTVTNAKIRDGAVGTTKLADASVRTAKLEDAAVTAAKLAPGAVGNESLAAGFRLGWSRLVDTPAGFADGVDDDRLAALACAEGQIVKRVGSAWSCADPTAAGAGLARSGNAFHLLPANTSTLGGVLAHECGYGLALKAIDASGAPVCGPANERFAGARGNTIHAHETESYLPQAPSVAIGEDGLPFFAYPDPSGSGIRYGRCVDVRCAQNATMTTIASETSPQRVVAGVSADGLPHFATLEYSWIRLVRCLEVACGTYEIGWVGSGNDDLKLGLTTDGNPMVATNSWSQIQVYSCSDPACSATPTTTGVYAGDYAGSFHVLPRPDGHPTIVYGAQTYGGGLPYAIKIVSCADEWCSMTQMTVIETMQQPTIAATVGIDGLPIIAYSEGSYYGYGGSNLSYVKCTRYNCSSFVTGELRSDTGGMLDIAVPEDGIPIIAVSSPAGLSLVRCQNASCEVPETDELRATLVDADAGASYVELTLGVDGLPLLTYLGNNGPTTAHLGHVSGVAYQTWR